MSRETKRPNKTCPKMYWSDRPYRKNIIKFNAKPLERANYRANLDFGEAFERGIHHQGAVMISMKKILATASFATLVGIGTLAATGSASAYVACNREGDCWHTES